MLTTIGVLCLGFGFAATGVFMASDTCCDAGERAVAILLSLSGLAAATLSIIDLAT